MASSTFDNASIFITPSGYKASFLYPTKPLGTANFNVTRGTTATRVNASGLIESVASGVPRIDYTGGGCGSLLVEPAATNLVLRSEEFDDAYWSKIDTTITANDGVSPDATTTADKLVEDATTGEHLLRRSLSLATGTYTWGVFAKAAGRKYVVLRNNANGGAYRNTCFDVELGTIVFDGLGSAKIESFGNGWFRIIANSTETSVVARNYEIHISDNEVLNNSAISYTGDGTSGVLFWGAQLETGSVATSYIPTVASTVTRNADTISRTAVSGLIGQTEGTMFVDILFTAPTSNNPAYIQTWQSQSERMGMFYSSSANLIRPYLTSSGQSDFTLGFTPTAGTRYKMAFGYKANDYVFFVNGSQVTIDTRAAVPAGGTAVFLGCLEPVAQPNRQFSNINAAAIYTSRLSNSELQSLTTL